MATNRRSGEASPIDRLASTMASIASRLGRVEQVGHTHRGGFRTTERPSARTLGLGATIYDIDLHKPLWSDGATWRDATGTAV